MKRLLPFILIALTAGLAHAEGVGTGPATSDPIADRQAVMSNVSAATGMGAKMVKGEIPFDAATAEFLFRTVNSSAHGFGYMFPEGSETGGKTEASPKIWEDRAGFEDMVAKFVADTKGVKPADLDAFRTAFGTMTENCGACHKAYRVKN